MLLQYKNAILLGSITLICMGCSNPSVQHRLARFNSPEVYSQPFQFKVSAGTVEVMETPLEVSEAIDFYYDTQFAIATSLGKGFEIGLKTDLDYYRQYSIKYQFIGTPGDELTTDSFSHALLIGFSGYSGYLDSGELPIRIKINNKEKTGGISYSQSWDLLQVNYDIAWLAGYRYNENVLIYSNLFYSFNIIDIEYFGYSSKSDNHFKIRQATYEDDIYGASIALEYRVSEKFSLTGELLHQKSYIFSRNCHETVFNLNTEFRF